MSHMRGSINLMQFVGAELRSMEIAGKSRNVVVIPVDFNDISVTCNKETGEPNAAFVNLRAWETNEKFRSVCVERNKDKEGYTPPSHQLSVSYGEDFQKVAEMVAERRLRGTEKFMSCNPSDEEVKKAARYEVSNKQRIGMLHPMEPQPAQTFKGIAPQTTSEAYIPPTDANHATPDDDLPF